MTKVHNDYMQDNRKLRLQLAEQEKEIQFLKKWRMSLLRDGCCEDFSVYAKY